MKQIMRGEDEAKKELMDEGVDKIMERMDGRRDG